MNIKGCFILTNEDAPDQHPIVIGGVEFDVDNFNNMHCTIANIADEFGITFWNAHDTSGNFLTTSEI